MKVVENLADHYQVALLNSKNSWRIRGQESYAYEIAQWFDYDLAKKTVVVPIGNAGNITAIMQGFLRLHDLQIIDSLPGSSGPVPPRRSGLPLLPGAGPPQTHLQAGDRDPQRGPGRHDRQPGVHARVIRLVDEYHRRAGDGSVAVVQVSEQEIMDSMLLANRHGHIADTQGGESLAGYGWPCRKDSPTRKKPRSWMPPPTI